MEFQRLSLKTDVVEHLALWGKHFYKIIYNNICYVSVADEEVYFPNVWEIPVPEKYRN